MQDIYNRTLNNCKFYENILNNCKFYENESDKKHLLNEIGVLRGVAYCLENAGVCIHSDDFLHFIELQNKLLNN